MAEASEAAEISNVRQVTIGAAKQYCLLNSFDRLVPMIWGPPGVGKSEAIEQLTQQLGNSIMIDIRLSLWDPTDVKGIPYYDHNSNTMKWAQPHELPGIEMAAKYNRIILFLDELPSATPSVQAAIYQLILNHQIGEYKLPGNVDIIGAGNRESDKGVTYRMPKPLANRFTHYEIRVDHAEWIEWAVQNKIHADIVGYLQQNKSDLFRFDPKSQDKSFATPRSWIYVHKTLRRLEENPELLNPGILPGDHNGQPVHTFESMLTDVISGQIGYGTAIKFMAHREVVGTMPSPEDIVLGKNPKLKTDSVSAHNSLVINVAYELSDIYLNQSEDLTQCVDHALRYWMDNLQPELIIMGTRMLFTTYNIKGIQLRKLDVWPEFSKRYGDLIYGA